MLGTLVTMFVSPELLSSGLHQQPRGAPEPFSGPADHFYQPSLSIVRLAAMPSPTRTYRELPFKDHKKGLATL